MARKDNKHRKATRRWVSFSDRMVFISMLQYVSALNTFNPHARVLGKSFGAIFA
jgi:hypothetical protein